MKEQFIPYQQATHLKELGFNEKCFDVHRDVKPGRCKPRDRTPKILWQQAFDWFREKHNLFGIIDFHASRNSYMFKIKNKEYVDADYEFETYQEARSSCLNKIIQIVESKQL